MHTAVMPPSEILVADDQPGKLAHFQQIAEGAAGPNVVVHTASTAAQAQGIIETHGTNISTAVLDFDFNGEAQCGADLTSTMRSTNANTRIVCATAREPGMGFEEAASRTAAAGAEQAICAVSADFDAQLTAFICMST